MYGHIYSKSKDQPGKVANPARGQLNRENEYFSSLLSCTNNSAIQYSGVVFNDGTRQKRFVDVARYLPLPARA